MQISTPTSCCFSFLPRLPAACVLQADAVWRCFLQPTANIYTWQLPKHQGMVNKECSSRSHAAVSTVQVITASAECVLGINTNTRPGAAGPHTGPSLVIALYTVYMCTLHVTRCSSYCGAWQLWWSCWWGHSWEPPCSQPLTMLQWRAPAPARNNQQSK